jgi:competence protein ComEC
VVREPLLVPLLALAAGILAGRFNYFEIHELVWPLAISAALLAAAISLPAARRMRVLCLVVLLGFIGLATQVWHRQDFRPRLSIADGETALVEGCITDPPVFSDTKAIMTVHLSARSAARVTVLLKDQRRPQLWYGQRVEIAAKVRSPHNFQNPGEFDYAGWLANQHIFWTATASSVDDVRVEPGSCGHAGLAAVFGIRDWALARLDRLYPDDHQTGMLLKAVLLGQTAGVERRWTSDFRLTGTYHALVISGQHVAVLAVTLLFLLRLLHVGRIPSLAVAALSCWMYALVTGMSAPVVRAAGGFTLFLMASYLFRRVRIVNALAVVGFAYLLFDPEELFDPSFQLSFLSAAALALFALPLMERWTEPLRIAAGSPDRVVANIKQDPRIAARRVELRLFGETIAVWFRCPLPVATALSAGFARVGAYLADAVLVSACVQFGLALPMISYFHRVSFTGLSANAIVIPLLSCVVPLGFGAILTNWYPLAWATAWCLKIAEAVASWHSHWEPSWRIAGVPVWLGLLFSGGLVLWAWALRSRHKTTSLAAGIALASFVLICWQPWQPQVRPGWLEVSTIDVSQGDSIFVAFPNGTTMLVDAGGFPGLGRMPQKPNLDMGEDVVSPYLWSRAIHRLDYVVLTHGHSDHMQGLCAVLGNYHPRELWIGPEPESQAWEEARRCAAASGTAIKTLSSAAKPMRIGKTSVSILSPTPDYSPGDAAANDDSLVLLLGLGKRRVLLTGDAERPIESDLLKRCNLQPVTLLKVGHHGSRTSTSEEFLAALKPQFAFISDGYLNQFHHPHPDVLKRLEAEHAMVLRTDRQGLATFLTDGDRVEVSSYR